ncbi:hypothetical protein [Saliphagus infecundisoli]|uniref:Uncharacterized protein n=1 Tax=Saliphagus infecundisoli TaxID=1849069 RepID=A0ABD5QAB3_9EURY|nr:hypothetical protein [Saliphagus infecundisoli]
MTPIGALRGSPRSRDRVDLLLKDRDALSEKDNKPREDERRECAEGAPRKRRDEQERELPQAIPMTGT